MRGVAGAAKPADASARARGSSFNAAMRILPRPRREAMLEIYSFCRAVDDIADEVGPRHVRRQALAKWRRDIGALYTGGSAHARAPARLRGLAMAIHAFGLRHEDFCAVIDGMEMDVDADIRAPDLATLDLYCDRVAGAVGRLSARAFGMPQAEGQGLAHHLGRALQLTNILRDLDEDAARGRLYLPRELLDKYGIRDFIGRLFFVAGPHEEVVERMRELMAAGARNFCVPLIYGDRYENSRQVAKVFEALR